MIANPNAGQFVRVTPYGSIQTDHLGLVEEVFGTVSRVRLKMSGENKTLGSFGPIPNNNLQQVTREEAVVISQWLLKTANNTEITLAAYRAQEEEAERRERVA